jgi:hypothetical protein
MFRAQKGEVALIQCGYIIYEIFHRQALKASLSRAVVAR